MNENSSKNEEFEAISNNQTFRESELNNCFQLIWKHVNYTVHNSWSKRLLRRLQGFKNTPQMKTILTNISGCIKSGELAALMGPSGSGKSTLLECIVGKRRIGRTGDVFICGENVQNIEVAFVAQKNNFCQQLTVQESILFAAKLLIATNIKRGSTAIKSNLSEICDAVTQTVITNLGLDSCANNRVNMCSGGELKRLAIAQELVANPRILVLDEPTSGLDSISCIQVIKALKQLTQQEPKMAIMLTIHQPSFKVLSLFDKVYILNKTGECIYENKPELIQTTMRKQGLQCPTNHNPADFIIEVAYGENGFDVIDNLVSHHRNFYETIFVIPENSHQLSSAQENKALASISHTMTLAHRNLLTTIRNPLLFAIRLITTIAVPLFLTTIFGTKIGLRGGCPPKFDSEFEPSQLDYIGTEIETELKTTFNNVGNLFFLTLFVVFNSLMPTLLTFPTEMVVFKSEKANCWYGLNAFYFSKLVAEIPLQLFFLVIFWPFAAWIQNQCDDWWRCAASFASHLLNSFISQTFGYFFGAIFMHNIPASVFLGPSVCIIPFLLLSGLFIKTKSMAPMVQTLSYLSYIRFVVESSVVSIYGFGRCGQSNSLADGREAFVVWMSAMLGIYEETNVSENGTVLETYGAPTERFVEELIDAISGRFLSDNNEVRSSVMNEHSFEDWYLSRAIFALITHLIVIRLFAYIVIAFKAKSNE